MSDPSQGGTKLHRPSVARAQTGMSSIEYVLVLMVLAAIAVGAWKTFGEAAEDKGVSVPATSAR